MVDSEEEIALHKKLNILLDDMKVIYQYPQFIGDGRHRPHVTARKDNYFGLGEKYIASAAYLIEVVDKKRVVRTKFELSDTI